MKILKFNIRLISTILVITILSCFLISRLNVEVVAFENSNIVKNDDYQKLAQIVSGDPTMTAKLYTDPECTQLDQSLSTSGVELTNTWQVNTSRYLKVELENLSITNSYKVVIDLDQHLYANIKSLPSDDAFEEIKFTKNSPISVNIGKKYDLEEFSGVFEYTTKKGYTSLSIVLEIRYDNVLWNKFNNMNITAADGNLLNVIFIDDHDSELDRKVLTKITVSGNLDYNFRFSMSIDTDASNSISTGTIYASSENIVKFKIHSSTMDSPMLGCYYEQLLVEMDIPKVGEYVMEFDESNLVFNTGYGKLDYQLTHDTINNKIIILFNNLYMTTKQLFEVSFSFPAEMLTSTGVYTYAGKSKMIIPGGNNTGSDYLIRTDNYKIIMENKSLPNLSYLYSSGVADYRNKNAVQFMGGYGLVNKGADSGPLTILMTFNDKVEAGARVNLTTFRLNPDNLSPYLKITYTMEDEIGNPIWFDSSGNVVPEGTEGATREAVYSLFNPHCGNTLIKSSSILFHRGMLIESHKKYYFSSIKYTIQSVYENSQLWQNSAVKSYTSSTGTFWGYAVGSTDAKIYHTIKVFDENGELAHLRKEMLTSIKIVEQVSFGLKNPTVSKEVITAGESVKISGEAFVVDYPYSANNVLNVEGYNMRIGISLPKGASINTDSIEIIKKNKTLFDIVSVTSKEQSDGSVFWIIEMKAVGGEEIGYVSEKLGTLPNGNSIKFSFEINTERTTAGTNINLRENLFFAAYKISNAAGGSYAINAGVDKYDLNGNGKTTDNIGIFSTANVSFQITALSAKLSIDDSLRTIDNSQTGNDIVLTNHNDSIIYDLSINCESGGRADNFIYFIPITNKNTTTGEIIKDNNVSFCLNDAVSVYNSIVGNGVKVYYTDVSNLDYNSAYTSSADIWFEELPTGVSWSDITMIKIVSFDDFISNGSKSIVSLTLNYAKTETDFIFEAGMQSIWCSRGYYNYSLGNRAVSGHFSTEDNTVILNYTMPAQEITLTAAKDRTPSGTALIRDSIDNIPLFKNVQSYKITDIITHNVTLKSKDYLKNNSTTMSSEEANRSFGFTIAVNSDSPIDISQTLPLPIGSSASSTNTTIYLEIYNADIFSDNTTIRYIELTLKSDNGVTIPIVINIERELTEVLASEMGLTVGKEYRPFSSSLKNVVISSDSSFTAQFVGELLPDNYKGRNLTFDELLGVGTTIVMADWTNTDLIEYYYYIVTSKVKVIDLTDFKKMGTNNVYYENPTGSMLINENLLFIIDLEKANTVFENSITLNRILKDDSVNENKLYFETIDNRKFDLVVYNQNVLLGEDISISYEVHDMNANDSKYNGNKMTLVISASQNSYVPADAYINLNNMRYYANGNGEFIIPLGDTQTSGSYQVNFAINSKTISSNYGDIELNISLWSSTNNLKPFGGFKLTNDQTVNVSTSDETAFDVTYITDRFLKKEDLKKPVTLSYKTKGLTRLTLEMHQKISEGYTLISTGINTINGDTTHYGGVFELSVSDGRINIKFNEMIEEGSYKLVFRLYDELKQESKIISYTIIISE